MASETWPIDVDGVSRQLVVEDDPATNRTLFRVDGKMVARPLPLNEKEREFVLGRTRYTVRRLGHGFDLDWEAVVDNTPALNSTRTYSGMTRLNSVEHRPEKVPVAKIVLTIVGVLVAGWAFTAARSYARWWMVKWQPYTGPNASFRVSFPRDAPTKEESVAGGSATATVVSSRFATHEYAVVWMDMQGGPKDGNENLLGPVFETAEKAIYEKRGGTILSRSDTRVSGHLGEQFIGEVPARDGHPDLAIHGKIVANGRRLFVVAALTPKGEGLTYDVGEFLRSLELPQ